MTCARLLLGVAGLLAAGMARAQGGDPPPLDGLLEFADPRSCTPGPTFDRLLHSLLRDTTGTPVRYGPVEVPAPFAGAIGAPRLGRAAGRYIATIPVTGRWLGLLVTSVAAARWDGGDGNGFVISVRAPRRALLAALEKAGFDPPAHGRRLEALEGDEGHMRVTGNGRRAALDCS